MFPNYNKPCDVSKLNIDSFCHDHCVNSLDLKVDCLKYEKQIEFENIYTPDEIFRFYQNFVNNLLSLIEYEVLEH